MPCTGGNVVSTIRVGIFVDAENIIRSGGHGLRYDLLLDFALRQPGAVLQRAVLYQAVDQERQAQDDNYRSNLSGFQRAVRDMGWQIVEKPVRWFGGTEGLPKTAKANMDIDLAVDALTQSQSLDHYLLVTGDGDFVPLIRALQSQGKRVEILALQNVAGDLQQQADAFYSGYLIPGLLPVRENDTLEWGKIGSRVRGICTFWDSNNHFGFLRYIKSFRDLSKPLHRINDKVDLESPYQSAFLGGNDTPRDYPQAYLALRQTILEFDLVESERKPGTLAAKNCKVITSRYAL